MLQSQLDATNASLAGAQAALTATQAELDSVNTALAQRDADVAGATGFVRLAECLWCSTAQCSAIACKAALPVLCTTCAHQTVTAVPPPTRRPATATALQEQLAAASAQLQQANEQEAELVKLRWQLSQLQKVYTVTDGMLNQTREDLDKVSATVDGLRDANGALGACTALGMHSRGRMSGLSASLYACCRATGHAPMEPPRHCAPCSCSLLPRGSVQPGRAAGGRPS